MIGATILVLLPNLTNMLGIPDFMEFIVIGGALLFGAIIDESFRQGRRPSATLVLSMIRQLVVRK
jgi:ribose/xylose/arabinose/galactoside ABC-type transport system permease subunit